MSRRDRTPNLMNVYARWRPPTPSEAVAGEIDRGTSADGRPLVSVSVHRKDSASDRPWSSPAAFKTIFTPEDDNAAVYRAIIAPVIPNVLRGETCSFFAYGHSGSGKTHTIMGYDFEHTERLGLCLAATRQLFKELDALQQREGGHGFGVGLSLYELRKNSAFDLLNGRTECHIREGYDGKMHIRGQTEVLEGGKVRVQPIVQRPCWTYESLHQELQHSLGRRSVGSSTVHDQSSRTHAVLELELINRPLVEARQALIDRQSELVPVGKRATDISIEEQSNMVLRTAEGGWEPNPAYRPNQARIDEAVASKAEYEARVTAAEEHVAGVLESNSHTCLGGKMVFVDLAGAEYQRDKSGQPQTAKQTPQERQEGRQINTDLLALKEVIRAWSTNQPRIPFRSSPLTMVLREHFVGPKNATSAMIVTVSPAKAQYPATLNSLKYGSLVGAER
ncbi:Kinesin-like protein [Tolypocladium paradoxum]|uniref:Kinesin-like protein n=1 Tax=Tolypocladium paradoxum TaxID=94208 RepID=A0A2S4KYN2_9HYPO|nr:Kinesin-like protein [Tolypocladium paradoxum]